MLGSTQWLDMDEIRERSLMRILSYLSEGAQGNTGDKLFKSLCEQVLGTLQSILLGRYPT
jgi:hypothetical protein